MNLHATHAHESELNGGRAAPAAGGGRFAYATGARPLQGYTIKRGIGHGGFGEVYYATSDAGKEVALKLIRRNLDVELRGVTQCLNLKHPNLLSLYDVRQDDHDDKWVVMELMAGDSLEELLARSPNGLPPDEALAWIHGIAAGTAYLHDHGIVHRDLKPGNIFVDEGIVKIGDYGLSKFISCSRRSGQTGSVGTVHYMAPEIANGRYGKEIDIYAVGIILYEILTGHVPFEGESVGEILMKHLTAEPDVSRLAEPYRTIVARSLAKDPAKRFNSVGELIALLPPVPAGTATAAARFAGPNPAAAQRTGFASEAPGGMPPAGSPVAVAAPFPPTGSDDHRRQVPNPTGFSLAKEIRVHSAAALREQEPIARWIRETWDDLATWWERRNFQPWQKLLMLFAGIFVAFNTAPIWVPTLLVGLLMYLAYRVVRAIWLSYTAPPGSSAVAEQRAAPAISSEGPPAPRGSITMGKALMWLFAAGAVVTVAAQTMENHGNLDRTLNDDDVMAVIPVGAMCAALGFVLIHIIRFFRRLIGKSYSASSSSSRINRRWFPLIIIAWIAVSWYLVALDVGPGRMSDRHTPLVIGVMAILAAIATGLRIVYLAAIPGARPAVAVARTGGAMTSDEPSRSGALAAPVAERPFRESPTRRRWRQAALIYTPAPPRERLTQAVGSLLFSALVCAVVALVMVILRGETPEPTQYAWLAICSMIGSWGVLIPAKLWEGSRGDPAMRRFVMLVVGLAFGGVAYAVTDWSLVSLPRNHEWSRSAFHISEAFYAPDGSPRLIAFLAYFGFLFAIPRWWRQADPLRSTRLSIWHTAVALAWAALLSAFWPFPQPWGWMLTATIAVAVQLASPWLSPTERSQLSRQVDGVQT